MYTTGTKVAHDMLCRSGGCTGRDVGRHVPLNTAEVAAERGIGHCSPPVIMTDVFHKIADAMTKLALSALSLVFCGAAFAHGTFSVTTYGAVCDGTTDDTAAIQFAINEAKAAGGGTVTFPGSTCLLNSNAPSSDGNFFYNIVVPSGVSLQGTTGSKLLQGSRGRHAPVWGDYVRNTVVAIGNTNYAAITYNNGPVYALNAITAGNRTVTLATPSNASIFAPGDYVTINETDPAVSRCDVCASQPVQLTGVNGSTGVLTLADPVLRSWSVAPVISKVTATTSHDIGLSNLIVQGAEPLAATEVYNLNVSGCQFLSDTNVGGSNLYMNQLNTVEHSSFSNNTFAPVSSGGPWVNQEMPQRNSQNDTWSGNTFKIAGLGFGEFGGNITMSGNHIYLHADGNSGNIVLGGLNVTFTGNDVHTVGNRTNDAGWGSIITDMNAPAGYIPYIGNIQITNNTIDCAADGNQCILLCVPGTVVSGNTFNITGSAWGIYPAGGNAVILQNTFQSASGATWTGNEVRLH